MSPLLALPCTHYTPAPAASDIIRALSPPCTVNTNGLSVSHMGITPYITAIIFGPYTSSTNDGIVPNPPP